VEEVIKTLPAALVGTGFIIVWWNFRKAKAEQKRHRWDPPKGSGVIELRRPFTMPQVEWHRILSAHKRAGWHIVSENPLHNIYTLEKD
jgi:hypothetical protein